MSAMAKIRDVAAHDRASLALPLSCSLKFKAVPQLRHTCAQFFDAQKRYVSVGTRRKVNAESFAFEERGDIQDRFVHETTVEE